MKSTVRWLILLSIPVCVLTALTAAVQPVPAARRPDADLCAVQPGAQPLLPATILEGMGNTDMPVTTTSAEARAFFNQGVSQMHSFWFLESERSFLQAAALDPDMAMAYWGISVSAAGDYRPAFQLLRDPYDGGRAPRAAVTPPGGEAIRRSAGGAALDPSLRAREAIEKAMSLRGKVTERERLYIEAEAARRNPLSTTRDADHIRGLRTLVAAYPDDLEAKSILGLALLDGYDSATRAPRTNTVEGVTLLHEVTAKNDDHFGAHHYLIHGWEGSATPEKAWHACKRYPELVPNIPHALHMPGHIYAQSDKIDEAIDAFGAAAANELRRIEADVLYPIGHHGHNVHFLVHALNLDGRFNDSMDRVRHMMSFRETPRERAGGSQRTPYRQGYYALVKTLVRFERWGQILDGTTIPVYDRPEQQAWRTWAIGLALASQGKLDEARAALAEMKTHVAEAAATKRPLAIAGMELDAAISARAGDRMRGYAMYRTAAGMESALLYTEPPSYPRPVAEGFGATAAALGDHRIAEEAYRDALVREPGSGRAYFGLASALQAQHRAAEAQEMASAARKAWDKADPDLPQLLTGTPSASGAKR